MPLPEPIARPGVVVAYVPDANDHASEHERRTLMAFVQQLAVLRGDEPGGLYDASQPPAGPVYFVPSCTLTAARAAAVGIRGPDDLFGGVVPHSFVGTKAVSHALVDPAAAAPAGWSHELGAQLGDAVLDGYTVFSLDDARKAGERLLASGPIRVKPVRATGGRGQRVAKDAAALQAALDACDRAETEMHGLVLEQDLGDVHTYSVGQVAVGGLVASYYGVQRLTRSNQGQQVFGGSDLWLVRGGYEALQQLTPAPQIRRAIDQAGRYEAAVMAAYPGLFASRSNYDVALGRDAQGRWRSGVLEQSWRVGGATGPELLGLEVLRQQPQRQRVQASCYEIFGDSAEPPPHATVYFRGDDPHAGRLTKYTVVHHDEHAR